MKDFFSRFCRAIEDHPVRTLGCYMGASIVLWTLQCSLLQHILSLDALEAIAWGGEFSWGHAKHPPLSGWVAEFFSALSGRADWGSYLACQVMLVTGVWFVYRTARLFLDVCPAVMSAALLYFLFYYLPSWMKFSTYFVEIALAPIAAYCFFAALEKKRVFYWALLGLVSALGILNKYSFGLQLAGFAIVFFAVPAYRKQFFRPGPWLAALICGALLIPHFQWLAAQDFICFRHVQDRMVEERNWYDTFTILGVILYPLANAAAVLYLARFPGWRTAERKSVDKGLFARAILLTMVPGIFYLALDLAGNSVIMMWFCTAASWTGLAVVALFPYRITPVLWRRVFLLLAIATAAMFTGTSIDLLARTGKRLHMRPEAITGPALAFWHEHRRDAIPVVYGSCWYAGIIKNYTPERPPVSEIGDPVRFDRFRPIMEERGALLIGKADDLPEFAHLTGYQVKFREITAECRSPWGRVRKDRFFVGYYPPRAEREAAKQ